MKMIVIYKNPLDYPEGYVARLWTAVDGVLKPTIMALKDESYDKIIEQLSTTYDVTTPIPRQEEDDWSVLETHIVG